MRTRVLSTAIMIPLVLLLTYLGGWFFVGAVLAVLWLAGYEFYRLMACSDCFPSWPIALAIIAAFVIGGALPAEAPWSSLVITVLILASLVYHMSQDKQPRPGTDWAVTIGGSVYLGWLGSRIVALRMLPQGMLWIALALGATWIADTAALLIGMRFGRHKLAPRISPRKTWEGAIGGWIAALLLTPLLAFVLGLNPWHGLVAGFLAGTIAPLGDLAESMFKRQVNAKDSGNLIPGHGGMLDRIDSLLFVVPLVFYYALLVTG